MRKLALLLGSLVVVASASAKEVVPAPVVVEEAPVQIVEKEVIVYRDKEEGFRPNGNIGLEYKYYGNTESQNHDDWNSANNYSRTQLSGGIQMTEAQKLEFRIRDYNSLDQENDRQTKVGTETRLRYFYNHGNLGDSKVNYTSRIQYRDKTNDTQDLEYMANFNFAEYMFNTDFVKTTNFTLAPRYAYVWKSNSSDYENQLGLDLYTYHELPLGFSFEFNVYSTQAFVERGEDYFEAKVEAYIYQTTNLYTDGNLSLDFNFEGGYDPYSWKKVKHEGTAKDYTLYMTPSFQVNYQVTPNLSTYVAAGATYQNWTKTAQSSASDWRWQPTAWAGFNVAF